MKELVVCLGAQKAATSTLHSLMAKHSQVAVTNIKETGFFFRDELYEKGYGWYRDEFFEDKEEVKLFFEADPNYMCFPTCIDRLKQCGDVSKVIVMLRNPIDRLISSYMMMQRYELEHLSLEEAIHLEPERIKKGVMERETFNYVERSLYARQIKDVFDRFSKDQVYFIVFEDFVKNQTEEFRELQEWLGLDVENFEPKRENASFAIKSSLLNKLILSQSFKWVRSVALKLLGNNMAYSVRNWVKRLNSTNHKQVSPELSEGFKRELHALFYQDILETEKLTGLNLSAWIKQ